MESTGNDAGWTQLENKSWFENKFEKKNVKISVNKCDKYQSDHQLHKVRSKQEKFISEKLTGQTHST